MLTVVSAIFARAPVNLTLRDLSSSAPSSSQGVKLAADALHGASPEAQELGGFQDPRSLCKLSSHLPLGRAVYLRPTKPHALGDGSLEPGLDPLPNHRALELSKGSAHLEN